MHCERVLKMESMCIKASRYTSRQVFLYDVYEHNQAMISYNFLLRIIKEPKKYLYTKDNIDNTIVHNGKTVGELLRGVMGKKFDNGTNLLHELSDALTHVSKHIENNVWIYDTNNRDIWADKILKINKIVSLLDEDEFVKIFKKIIHDYSFAIQMPKR